ncbi:MAG: DUF3800 domain-containing protein [Sedimentisphaerales bacterium]|nr:DUF3800 domain-containing protein [Sedimentisphaerales bacterium]
MAEVKVIDTETVNNYYVDEAGDLNLFDKRGRVIIGRQGVSRMFMVGVARLPDPKTAHQKFDGLRAALLADAYFKGVPSMQLDAGKTALYFHATDDLPEVRREVFRLLPELDAKVIVGIRRKEYLVSAARFLFQRGEKFRSDEVYDDLIKRLFRNLQHKALENRIVFAIRGKSLRQHAFEQAIERAKVNFEIKTGIPSDSKTVVIPAYSSQFVGLQIIDYYLWALQRLFEREEDRFFNLIAKDYRLIMDLDDKRNKPYGEWYSDTNPLELKKIKPLIG